VTAADLNVVTSSRYPEEYPGGRPVRAVQAGIGRSSCRRYRDKESFDATGFRRATTPRSPHSRSMPRRRHSNRVAQSERHQRGRRRRAPRGRRYRPHIRFGYLRAHGHRRRLKRRAESTASTRSTNFVAAGDPAVAAEGVDILDDASGHGSWVTAAAASAHPKAVSASRRTQNLYIGRALTTTQTAPAPSRISRPPFGPRTDAGADLRPHESRVTALHRGTGGRDRVRDQATTATIIVASGNDRMVSGSSPTRRQGRIRSR